jgi:ankyrin repeat protein
VDVVILLLARKEIQINQAKKNGVTPHDHPYVRLLLTHKDIDVNITSNTNGATPLWIACKDGHVDVVKLLLARKEIKVNQANEDGATPLYYACWMGHVGVVRLLLARKDIKVNQTRPPITTPLDVAIHFGHSQIADLLRRNGGR